MTYETFVLAMQIMAVIAVFVFLALFFVKAGYGMFASKQWGLSLPNRVAWVLMEAPAFCIFLGLWIYYGKGLQLPAAVFGGMYLLHYFQRSFVFPCLIKGKSRMPVVIMLMGVMFNCVNAVLLYFGFFHFAPESYQMGAAYLLKPCTIIGILVFFAGMAINMHSDYVIRHLRKPGDTKHYLPQKGMYKYVTSGNYFGEIVEWTGLAIASCSPAAWLFVWWTFANLAPRAKSINKKYRAEFGDQAVGRRKGIIPFIF
ncbi:MAG: DUF1295 domain-containing protein [Bacteroidales bacterium]|nr:DUF1295 domain-containing protein [Bacteroidales bacterium]